MKSKPYSLLEQGILKKMSKVIVTYKSLIEPTNTDTSLGEFTLYGIVSNDDPPIQMSDSIHLYPSTDPLYPYRSVTINILPEKEVTSIFFTLLNDDNEHNLNSLVTGIEIITEQGSMPIGLGIIEPVALDATDIEATSFTANWTEIEEATGYRIDVATDIEFENLVTGFDNLDVGNVLTYSVTGLSEDTCHFYRVRAYNASFTSKNSNEIHVGDNTEDNIAHTVVRAINYTKANLLSGASGLHSLSTNSNASLTLWYLQDSPLPNEFTVCFWHKRAEPLTYDDKYLTVSGSGLDVQIYIMRKTGATNANKIIVRYGGDHYYNVVNSDNTYNHVAVVLNNTTHVKSVYYNGVLIGTNTGLSSVTTANATGVNAFVVGTGAGIDRYCRDYRIYDKALSITEVNAVMNDTYTHTDGDKLTHIKGTEGVNEMTYDPTYPLVLDNRDV